TSGLIRGGCREAIAYFLVYSQTAADVGRIWFYDTTGEDDVHFISGVCFSRLLQIFSDRCNPKMQSV
ncbi:hypothetical protein, partial [Faecalibaculum rodentium]|uniref:hypothetical protein n=1 Tax=Faecalibaculum rodentium TaxID=1702221 RepID=UPI00248AB365